MWLSWVFCFRVSPGCNPHISQNWSFTPRLDCTTVCFQTHVIVSRIQFCADYWRESFGPLLIVAWICPVFLVLKTSPYGSLFHPKPIKESLLGRQKSELTKSWKWPPTIFALFYWLESSHEGSSHSKEGVK